MTRVGIIAEPYGLCRAVEDSLARTPDLRVVPVRMGCRGRAGSGPTADVLLVSLEEPANGALPRVSDRLPPIILLDLSLRVDALEDPEAEIALSYMTARRLARTVRAVMARPKANPPRVPIRLALRPRQSLHPEPLLSAS